MQINIQILLRSFDNSLNEDVCPTFLQKLNISPKQSDLNDQNLFQFTRGARGARRVSSVLRFVFDIFVPQRHLAIFFILFKLKPDITCIDLTSIKSDNITF